MQNVLVLVLLHYVTFVMLTYLSLLVFFFLFKCVIDVTHLQTQHFEILKM